MKIADIRLQVEMTDEQDCNMFVEMVNSIARLMLQKGKWVGMKADYVEGFVPPADHDSSGKPEPSKDAN